MLDKYLEPSIRNKLQTFYLLRSRPEISIKEIKELLKTTTANAFLFLHELSRDLCGIAEIQIENSFASLLVYEDVSFLELLHGIYSD